MYDIIIIGGGPAGLSAAIYAQRANMKTLVIEKLSSGGQIVKTNEVDNYPGFYDVPTGIELGEAFLKHATNLGANIVYENVKSIENAPFDVKVVHTKRHTYMTKSIIFAMGASPKKLGVDGEAELSGSGVSYCAYCDGAFFKGKEVAVIGGGNTACEDAVYLSKLCKRVYIINRSKKFRATASIFENAKRQSNITIITDAVCEKFNGEQKLQSIDIKNTITQEKGVLNVDGVIVAIGVTPDSKLAIDCGVEVCDYGFIKTDMYLKTNIKGIFAAGDVRTTPLRQIVTAAADGAVAAVSATAYVNELGVKTV